MDEKPPVTEHSAPQAPPPPPSAAGQVGQVGEVARSVGYVLKQAQATLHAHMDAELRPLGLTVPQYVCLEMLRQRPGLTNAELARSGFVSAQSMNAVVKGLQSRGIVERPATAPSGRRLPIELTAGGLELLDAADARVSAVERQMLAPLAPEAVERLLGDLGALIGALREPAED